MTATEELRRMLDERGIEYETFSGTFATKTEWPCMNGLLTATFVEYDGGSVRFEMSRWYSITPEQAIEASLGAGVCHNVCNSVSEFTCSACGFNCDLTSWISLFDGDVGRHRHHHHGKPNFCPNCGRKVVP